MIDRFQFAHGILWRSDAWYRRAWYIAPQIAAVVTAGWLLTSGGSGSVNQPGGVAGWGVPTPQEQIFTESDALRDRAETDQHAFETVKKLADAGDPVMQFEVATLYDSSLKFSKLVAPNMNLAMHYYRMAAEHGHVVSQYNYGLYLVQGTGVPKDVAAGIPWLVKAAAGDDSAAMQRLGILYRDGDGVTQSQPLSLQWFQKAANAGDTYSEAEIGAAYWDGKPPYRKDAAEALQWYRKAAVDPQQAPSARMVGIAYRDGIGVPPDGPVSLQWFQKAADNGDHYSQAEIGAAYWDGKPPYRKNVAEAVQWYRKAAVDPEQYPSARMLGIAYRDGLGVERDLAQARYWFGQAALHGDKTAAELAREVR